jgi:hypothetical protein
MADGPGIWLVDVVLHPATETRRKRRWRILTRIR